MKLEKILKKLPPVIVEEMDKMAKDELEKAVVQAEEAIDQATEELEANPQYQAAKETAKDISSALRDTKSYQRAKIAYALLKLKADGA